MDIFSYMQQLAREAKKAAAELATATTAQKNTALEAMAQALEQQQEIILMANQKDIDAGRENNLNAALLDRLTISKAGFTAMVAGLRQVVQLADPVGAVRDLSFQPSGIQVGKMRVPLGVVGIIYESRPNVTIDAAALCLKAGNAAILRGGSEAKYSNQAIAQCITQGLQAAELATAAVQVVNTTDRAAVGYLVTMPEYVDVIVPRGGKGLIERISSESKIPVIKHLDGVCHVYVDCDADLVMAQEISFNAKTQRYGTCNTMETLLVAQNVAAEFLPALCERYRAEGVELRGCTQSCAIVTEGMQPATEADWYEEYLAPILAVRVVTDMDAAIAHINQFGSGHTDTIVTQSYAKSQRFLRAVDSSSVIINASTRFADGFEYGLGAEIGISTDKLHARGPVGLEGLTSEKFIVFGQGHIRK